MVARSNSGPAIAASASVDERIAVERVEPAGDELRDGIGHRAGHRTFASSRARRARVA